VASPADLIEYPPLYSLDLNLSKRLVHAQEVSLGAKARTKEALDQAATDTLKDYSCRNRCGMVPILRRWDTATRVSF